MSKSAPTITIEGNGLSARHLRRVALLLTVCGSLTAAMTLGWTLGLAFLASWKAALIPAPGVLAGLLAVWFARQGRPYVGGTILTLALYGVICFTSFYLDQTSAQMPRTIHLYLVPVATGVYMALRGNHALFRQFVVAVIFVTFAVLASSSWGNQPAYNLPDELRIIGGKINTVAAVLAMYLAMHIMQADVEARNAYEADLRDAVRTDQLALYYQPQVDHEGRLTGAEALLRWPHPRRGMISPAEFIPLAEKTGLILPMGDWVLDRACQHLAQLATRPDTAHLTIAVNISVHQIRQPDFVVKTMAAIERHHVDPQRLKLELRASLPARWTTSSPR